MTETKQTSNTSALSSPKMLRAMVGIGIICAVAIAATFRGTLPIIEKNRAEALEKAIFNVIPGTVSTQAFTLTDDRTFVKKGEEAGKGDVVYAGYDDEGNLLGIAIEAQGQGYADIIRILYGYAPDKQTIVGMYVLESKETPGLGDKIQKDPAFLANFEALDVSLQDDGGTLKNKIIPVKHGEKANAWEIDAITGATISSRAIGNTMAESTERWIPLIYRNRETFNTNKEDEQ